ncbi:MAG: hypothetical protein NXI12_07440 [Alphaproteobacteria bacterium]|nr:hypothetical protein [Alphaproteobacteria bacterium]
MTLKPLAPTLAFIAVLAACGQEPDSPAAGAPADVSQTNEAPDVYGLSGSTVLIEGADALAAALTVPEGLSVVPSADGGHVTVSGQPADPRSGGRTSGAYITIDGAAEQAFSGQMIEVMIVMRGDDTALRAAYSTAESGNSGWTPLAAETEFAVARFTYDVPLTGGANGDYLGVYPARGPVDIAAIAIRRADEQD